MRIKHILWVIPVNGIWHGWRRKGTRGNRNLFENEKLFSFEFPFRLSNWNRRRLVGTRREVWMWWETGKRKWSYVLMLAICQDAAVEVLSFLLFELRRRWKDCRFFPFTLEIGMRKSKNSVNQIDNNGMSGALPFDEVVEMTNWRRLSSKKFELQFRVYYCPAWQFVVGPQFAHKVFNFLISNMKCSPFRLVQRLPTAIKNYQKHQRKF